MATYYWVGGTGTWNNSSTTNWATVSGGAGGNGPPTNADIAIFDSNSGTAAVVTVEATAVSLSTTVNKSDINLSLSGSPTLCTSAGTLTFTTGTITLNNNVLTCGVFATNNTNTRTIAFGTGNITVTGNNTTIANFTTTNLTTTGTPLVVCSYSGSTGTRSILGGGGGISFNIIAGTDTFSTGISNGYASLDFTGFSGTLTNTVRYIGGNLTISSGMTLTAGANATFFQNFIGATGLTQLVTTNGKTLDFPITVVNASNTVQLQDNLTMGSTRTFTLTAGTLDLTGNSGNWTLSAGTFLSSNTNTRAISFGTGNITLTGNAASVVNFGNNAGLTISGTPVMNLTYSGSTGTRTITYGTASGSEARSITMNITAGSDIIAITNGSNIRGLDFNGFTGSYTNAALTVFGNVRFSAGMTLPASANQLTFAATTIQNLTSSGQTLDFPIGMGGIGGGIRLQDSLVGGSTRTLTQQHGTLDLNGNNFTFGYHSSSFSSARSIAFGTSTFSLNGGSGTVWGMANMTNFSYTGTPNVYLTYAGAVGTRAINAGLTAGQSETNVVNFIVSAGSDTFTANSPVYVKNLDFTGFSGTLNNIGLAVYGSLTYSATMTVNGGGSGTSFISTAAGNTITSAGKTMDFAVTFNGIGGVWTCQDALTLGSTRTLTMTNGTLNLRAGVTSTVGSFVTTGTNQKYLGSSTPGTQATISDASGVNSVSFLTIQDSVATGGADWEAYASNGNVDAGNNLNWDFGATPILGTEYEYKLRSFTQPRRF